MDQVRQIDTSRDNQINEQEVIEAMKPNGFLSNEENLQAVGDLLNDGELTELDQALLNSLENSLQNLKNQIMEKEYITDEDKAILGAYTKLLGGKYEEEILEINNFIIDKENQESSGQDNLSKSMENFEQLGDNEKKALLELLPNSQGTIDEKIDAYLNDEINWGNNSSEQMKILQSINILNLIIKEDQEKSEKLKTHVEKRLKEVGKKINKIIANNDKEHAENPLLNYKKEDVMLIQLWANVCYEENLKIDGKRDGVYGVNQDDLGGLTNIYIYRFELTTRGEMMDYRVMLKKKEFNDLLSIPNIDTKLQGLPKNIQNRIMNEFLGFFLEIKRTGMAFENKIGDNRLEQVLDCLILAERTKDMPMSEFIQEQKDLYINDCNAAGKQVQDSDIQEIERILSQYNNPQEYYRDLAAIKKNNIIEENNLNKENNYIQHVSKYFKKIDELSKQEGKIGEIQDVLNELYYKEIVENGNKFNKLPQRIKESIYMLFNTYFTIEIIKKGYPLVASELDKYISETNAEYSKYESEIDILSQFNSKDKLSVSRDVTFEEYKKLWPVDANANEKNLKGTLGDYNSYSRVGVHTPGPENKEYRNNRVPRDIYRVNVPGCNPIIMRITDSVKQKIVSEKTRKIVMLDYKSEASQYKAGLGAGPTTYDINTVNTSNEKNIHVLGLQDLAYAEKDKQGNIKLYSIETGELLKTIDKDTQDNVDKLQKTSLGILDCPEVSEVRDVTDENGIFGMQAEINSLLDKMNGAKINWGNTLLRIGINSNLMTAGLYNKIGGNLDISTGGLSSSEVNNIREMAISMQKMGTMIRAKNKDWINLKNRLAEMKSRSKNELSNEVEQYIDSLYDSVSTMIEFTKPGGGLDNLIKYVSNTRNVDSNDNSFKLMWNRLKNNGFQIFCAIACAVGVILAIPSGGASLLTVAALGTLAGMVGSRVGQEANEFFNNIKAPSVTVGGKKYIFSYENPTDIEEFLKGNLGKKEFFWGLTKEFVLGTASTFGFMKVGMWIGQGLAKTHPKLAAKIRPKAFNNTEQADHIFNQVAQKGGEKGFLTKFSRELLEECEEESTEEIAGAIGDNTGIPLIGGLASIYHCITPGPNISVLSNNNASFEGVGIEGNKIMVEMRYTPKIDSMTGVDLGFKEIQEYYEKAGYTPNDDGTFTKDNEDFKNNKKINVLRVIPTNASIEAREFTVSPIGKIGGVTVDHTTGQMFYDVDKVKDIERYAIYNGLGPITIDVNGVITLVTSDNLQYKLHPQNTSDTKNTLDVVKTDYFGSKSHKFEVTEAQARGNSHMMDNILEEINEQNKSEKLEELRKIIGEQYKQATGQELNLTDEQLLSVLDAHEQDGVLGELTLGQLKQKVQILSETITDKNVRRFLLEAGFCGKLMDRVKSSLTKSLDYSEHGRYMEQNVDRIIPWSYFTELDFVFRAGQTEFLIEQTGNGGYRVVNLTDYHTYEGGFGSETTIGREGDIPIQSDDYASRQHLRLKIDSDGNVIIRDISSNGTRYFFTDRQVGTQYIWEIEQQYKENGGKNGNDRYEENGYKIGEKVNIPRSNGRVTRAIITEYNPQTGEYRVEWSEDGKNCHKDVTKEQLDSVNNEGYEGIQEYDDRYEENGYKIGEEVNIPRSNGRVTKATITAYNPQTGEYRVEWSEDGKNCHKDVTKEQLDSVNNEGHEGIQEYDNDGIAISGNNERSERGVNTERKEMSEVHRNSDVVAIGDLHGSYAALKGNLEYAGLAVEVGGHLQWTGGSSKVVFQGDILADRGTDGLRIINEIHSLREQARNEGKGGDIDIIVGNHDDFMISYLTQRNGINDNGVEQAGFYTSDQGLGLSELVEKYYTGEKYYKNIKTSEGTVVVKDYEKMLKKGYNNILSNMRNSSEGRILLEEICNMKLVSQVDDVLYLHTNPTDRIMELLITGKYNGPILYEGYEIGHVDIQISNGNTTIQENIDIINNMYQGYLKKTLLGQNIPSVSKRVFNGISDIFLNTGNRDDQMHNIQQYSYVLKDSGINMISHGHNGGGGYRDGFTNGGVRIVDTDHSYGKRGNTNKEHSVSVVKKEGGQVLIGDDVVNGNITHDSNQVIDADNPVNVDNPADMDITKEKQKDTQDNEQEIVSEIYLTPQEKQNIENLKKGLDKLGIDITSEDIYFIKNKEFTPEQWENLKILKSELDKLGITMTAINAVILADFKLTSKQWENVKNLKSEMDQLGIIVDATIVYFKNTILTEDQIRNIRDTKNKMDDYGINENISISDITYLMDNQLTYSQVGDIYKIKKETGIDIPPRAINDIINQSLTEEQINNLKKIKIDLEGIGIEVNARHIEYLKNITLTQEQISNLKKMKADLEGVGIKIFAWNVEFLKDITLTSQQIENLKIIRDGVGIDIYGPDILNLKDMKLTPEQIEDIKRIEDETGIHITAENIKVIVDNADILGVANNNPYEGYNRSKEEIEAHQRYTRGRIIETIQQEVQELIPENRDITENEIKYKIRTDLMILSKSERLQILNGISKVVNKFNTVRKYIDFENGPYKTPKDLLCAMRGITDSKIIEEIGDDITVIQHGTGVHFFVGDEKSYQIIHDKSLTDSGERSGGFNNKRSAIKDLEGTLSVGNSENPGEDWSNYYYGTVRHEGQHNRDSYFMIDKGDIPIVRAKDEILAFLRDGRGIFKAEKRGDTIEEILTKPKSEGGLYQYGLEGEARENHKAKVRELLTYANDLIELTKNTDTGLTRDKVISMLSDTSADGWKDLHANITEAVKLHLEREVSESKIINLKNRFIAKMQERAGNNRLLTNLVDFWNSIFPNYGIKLEAFWRAGTAEKHTVIDEIGQAESIDDIKHILNDPQYSHIGRGPNNTGGIEVSIMIDEVMSGKLEIDIIPLEIRPQIAQFIER